MRSAVVVGKTPQHPGRAGWYPRWGKRTLDLAVAAPMVVLSSPLIGALTLLVAARLGRPILFRQTRPGVSGKSFVLVKFRTMRPASPGDDSSQDEKRLTKLGSMLRRWSLDELPTFWNVLRGDMSLVGPRPLLMQYLDRYTPEQARRHETRPGITGWAQVNGRNALTWEEKFRLDVWYVDYYSLSLDLRILAMTAWKVLTGEGLSASGHATMPEFEGGNRGRQ